MKVYWSRCGFGHGNFGDRLTPLLLNHYGVRCEWVPIERAEFVGPGSVLERVPTEFRGTIWTTGLMQSSSSKNLPFAQVLGLRGQLTRARVQCSNAEGLCLGDAGLLCHLFRADGRRRFKLGIIPHFVDFGDVVVAEIVRSSSEIKVIDICGEAQDVVREAGECDYILSSSLHGLILADSLGIPNRWIRLDRGSEPVHGAGFKFRDYYSVFNLPPVEPLELRESDRLETILPQLGGYARPGIATIKERLAASLARFLDTRPQPTASEIAAELEKSERWMMCLKRTAQQLAKVTPSEAIIILADEDQIRGSLQSSRFVPFVERDGQYWGPPANDGAAISELERLRKHGARYFAVAPPAFWWLEFFKDFRAYLESTYPCCFESEQLRVFTLTERH